MAEPDLEQLATDWIAVRGSYSQPYEALDRLVRNEPNQALSAIKLINSRITGTNPDYELLANLSAGPLETLLTLHGPAMIDEIEHTARQDPEFRKCLGGVWQNAMSTELFARVEKFADRSWDVT